MNKNILASLVAGIALGLSSPTRAQEAWLWQNPKPTVMSLNAVHFPLSQSASGWAVGNNGSVFRTSNGGNTWVQVVGPETSANLEGVWFSVLSTGWAVGSSGTILKINTASANWTAQTSGVTQDLKAVHALNSNNAWAVGYSGNTGVIVRTTNGGTSWTSLTYSQARFTGVRIVDSFVGYAVGLGGVIYKTVDGGISWFALTSGTTTDLKGLYFSDTENGWVVGAGGLVMQTADGGFTWTTKAAGATSRPLNAINFSTATKGWIAGDSGVVLRTTNGGATWTASTTGSQQLRAVQAVGDTVWSVGAFGRIQRSVDAGVSWTALSSGVPQTVNALSFPTASTGFAAGPGGALLKSVDNGSNWTAVTGGTTLGTLSVTALHFPSATVGYAVGAGGAVMKTVDGGANWAALNAGTTSALNAVHFITNDRGFVAGAGGLVRMTVDGGATWTTPTVPTTSQAFMAIAFATPSIGWVAGGTAVRKTIDSGKTWTTQSNTSGGSFSGIAGLSVLDTSIAYVIRSGGVHRTVNGGATWTRLDATAPSGQFRAGVFTSVAQGYITTTAGALGVTADSGTTWTFQQLLPTTHALNAMAAAPGGRLFVAGTDGAILKLRPAAPSGFYYGGSPFVFGNGLSVPKTMPSYSGVVTNFSISPALPAGLRLDSLTGEIRGTPTAPQTTTTHSVTASNEASQSVTSISVTVRNRILTIDYPSSQLSLARGTAMTPQTPVITGVDPFGPYGCTSNPPLPAGLTLAASTCVLSGTPTNAQAAVNYIITVSNGFTAFDKSDTLRINVVAPPSNLTYSTPTAVYTVGQAITPNTATVTVVTGASLRYSIAPALPQGLRIDSLTGTISGTPAKSANATMYTVTVTSTAGSTTGTVNITVNGPPSDLSYPTVVFGVGIADTGRGTPSVSGAVTKWSISPAPPAGLKLDSLTGKFSGTATEASSGTTHTLTVQNSYGSTTGSVTIAVLNPIVLFSYPTRSFNLVVGTAMTSVSPIVAGTIPFTPVTYSVSPALPAGITLNANTGTVSGTPTNASQLSTRHTVSARNGVAAFTKTDTLTFSVQSTGLRLGAGGATVPALRLDGRAIALEVPEGTRTLRVTLRDMKGRTMLDRSVEWAGVARLEGVRESAKAGNGILMVRVEFVNAQGRVLGRAERRIALLAD